MSSHARTAALAAAAFLLAACATNVTRMAPEQAVDLSGRWNDVDSRLVAQEMIEQSLAGDPGADWASRHAAVRGGAPPTVIVGTVRNRALEHVPVNTFVRDLENAFVRSGAVQVVASRDERGEIRDERADQQEHAAAGTRARMAVERGADYMLQGEIQSIEDREGRRRVVYYQVDLTLVDLETNERAWVGQHKIKKYVRRPLLRF